MKHLFTKTILKLLEKSFGKNSEQIFKNSELIQYLNIKTISSERGSKSRGSFANIYAVYVLIEDYIKNNFDKINSYSKYEGAMFSNLLKRQRELPFGAKLQNHALNHRMNQEFKKHFPTCNYIPIIRVVETKRYWINENLLIIKVNEEKFNIARATIEIIDKYIKTKKSAFDNFIKISEQLKTIEKENPEKIKKFILSLLEPNFIFLILFLLIVEKENNLGNVLFEIIKQSKIEFNYNSELSI